MKGRRLGKRYEVIGELGRGGMGVVYWGRDPVLNREVAVKVVPPAFLTQDAEERFVREAQIVAQMDHPGIVPIHDMGRDEDGSLFFVMPVAPGETLRKLLKERSLKLGDVLEIGAQAADALEYSHGRGVVHRDIKPENLMVAREETGLRVRVMDFGLARAAEDERITKTGMVVGTASYVSPEQARSDAVDARSDLYSLATVLYECVAGEAPFSGEPHSVFYRIVHEPPRPPRSLGAPIREELEALLMRCLAKTPEARPRRAAEVAEALRRQRARLDDDEREKSMVIATGGTSLPRPPAYPFVGRDREMGELLSRLETALSGEGQLVVIGGEPGAGKSRLMVELAALARARRIRVLFGSFLEHDRAFPYQGFGELFLDYFRQPEAGAGSSERPDFTDLAGELTGLFPALAEMNELRSSLHTSQISPRRGNLPEERTGLFELLARTLLRISSGRPLVLLLDNLHGAEASIEALPYVVRRLRPTPTLLVATYRQTEVDRHHPLSRLLDGFAGDPRFTSTVLGPLTAEEDRRLVESVLGDRSIEPGLLERLHATTEGNPFFALELLRSLLESGGIVRGAGGAWGFSSDTALRTHALPGTIQAAVERRVERLPEPLREVLATASVLGRSFELADLETLSAEAHLDEALEALVKAGLFVEERRGADRVSFTSRIVRDVLYESLPRRRRRQLHRRVAELLEERHAGRLERIYPQLVHHYGKGDVPEKTLEYGLRLARRHLQAFNAEETIRASRTLLELVDELEPGPDLRDKAAEARLLLAQGLRLSGNLDGALREVETAARDVPPARAAELFLLAAEAAWQARRVDEALSWAERGIEAARDEDRPERLVRLLTMAATVANLRGDYAHAAALTAEAASSARKEREEELPDGGRLVVGLSGPVPAQEPPEIKTDEEAEVLGTVFETLVGVDEAGNLVPGLCEGWSVAKDARLVELRLRRGVTFSDGAPLDAEAVKGSLVRALSRRTDLSIAGTLETADDGAPDIRAISADRLEIRLKEPLPIFPTLLGDPALAVARCAGGDEVVGTGPFVVSRRDGAGLVLKRREGGRVRARLAELEFRTSLPAASLVSGLRSGELDLARDLSPRSLEEVLRDPRLRSGVLEAPRRATAFVQFHLGRPLTSLLPVRRALCGVVQALDLVWSTLGRFALPAVGLIPPGLLGHDPGRRPERLSPDEARALLAAAGAAGERLALRAAVHPGFQDRFAALTQALLGLWREIGVDVDVVTHTMSEYGEAWETGEGIDLLIGRWLADYDDPDCFAFGLHHSVNGSLRAFCGSSQHDALLSEARTERRPAVREQLYRRHESRLLAEASLLPLFHDVDVRVAGPRVRGARLKGTPPFVNFAELARKEAAPAPAPATRGILRIALPGPLHELDPAVAWTVEAAEALPNVFETLAKDVDGAHVTPWLASAVTAEDGGARYRIQLRQGVRFHDGRLLSARDVRASFERLIGAADSEHRWLFSRILGADRVLEGSRKDLEGVEILSPTELLVTLTEPISFFPVLLSDPGMSIVPEGTGRITQTSWREGAVGTGPFRVVRFEPGQRLELERHPAYWRAGYPKSEALNFRFGVPPAEIRSDFLSGRLSLASDLFPKDAEALRSDSDFAAGYRESPQLSTYFVVLNRAGALADDAARRRVYDAARWAAPALVSRRLGRLGLPARGLIPPGLLGSRADEHIVPTRPLAAAGSERLRVRAIVHPVFLGEFSAFHSGLVESLQEAGIEVQVVGRTLADLGAAREHSDFDLLFTRWIADYPDTDSFVRGILHRQEGLWGRLTGSAAIDELVVRGCAELDPAARHERYRQVEELLVRDAVLVPLFHEQVYRFARPEVEGLQVGFSRPVVRYDELLVKR